MPAIKRGRLRGSTAAGRGALGPRREAPGLLGPAIGRRDRCRRRARVPRAPWPWDHGPKTPGPPIESPRLPGHGARRTSATPSPPRDRSRENRCARGTLAARKLDWTKQYLASSGRAIAPKATRPSNATLTSRSRRAPNKLVHDQGKRSLIVQLTSETTAWFLHASMAVATGMPRRVGARPCAAASVSASHNANETKRTKRHRAKR